MEWLRYEEKIWPLDAILRMEKQPRSKMVRVWLKTEIHYPMDLYIIKMLLLTSEGLMENLSHEVFRDVDDHDR